MQALKRTNKSNEGSTLKTHKPETEKVQHSMPGKTQTIRSVELTKEMIDGGVRGLSTRCIFWGAVTAAGGKNVRVDNQTVRYTSPDGRRVVHLTPPAWEAAIINFDAGLSKPKPGTYRLGRPIHRSFSRPEKKRAATAGKPLRKKISVHRDGKKIKGVSVTGGRPPRGQGPADRWYGSRRLQISRVIKEPVSPILFGLASPKHPKHRRAASR